MRRQILVLAAVLTSLWMTCTQAAIEYEVIDLGTLGVGDPWGSTGSYASSINDNGQIVGVVWEKNWINVLNVTATLFDPTGAGSNINIGTLVGSEAYSINDTGQIVGYDGRFATLFDSTGAGSNIDLGTLGGHGSGAFSISNTGQIVGVAENSEGDWHATLFDPNGAGNNIDLGTIGGDESSAYSINDVGQIVGSAAYGPNPFNEHATLFDPTGAGNNINLGTLGGHGSYAYSINNTGQIVGIAENSEGDWHATLFDPNGTGNNIDLGTPGGERSEAKAINDAGHIVGWAKYDEGDERAILFDPTGAGNNIDLNTLIDPDSGWTLGVACDINSSGRIVGEGTNPQDENHAFLLVPISTKYSGGTGEPNDPYQIATAEDLMLLGESPEDYDKHFILTADIDLDPNLSGRKVFDRAVIAPDGDDVKGGHQGIDFTGIFDGRGHVISHLMIAGRDYLGLFGNASGILSNLNVEAVKVTGSSQTGGLVGNNWGGNITNCHSTGIVTGNADVGGLAGQNAGIINNSYSTAEVDGISMVGGLVGYNWALGITNCYSAGTVKGVDQIGGLVGHNWVYITNCYSKSMVTGIEQIGGLVGRNDATTGWGVSNGTIAMSYSTGKVHGEDKVGGLVGYNCCEDYGDFCAEITDSYWDIETSGEPDMCGYQDPNVTIYDNSYGKTTAEMKQQSTFEGWDFVGETVDGPNDVWKIVEGQTYPLLSWQKYGGGMGKANDPYLIYTAEHLNALGAEPNDYDKHFMLMADIDLSGYSYDAALIAPDVDPCDLSFIGASFAGVFNGNGHTISYLTITGESYLGLFGRLESGAEIKNLGIIEVNITGADYLGGIVGFSKGNITNCYCTGTITGDQRIGGLTGRNWGDITACYNAAVVTGHEDIGGIAGGNYGRTINSYNLGAVSSNRDVGGLVGENYSTINKCFSTGVVSGDNTFGGLVGFNGEDSIITSSFWDVERSGQSISYGGIGKTTAEMQTAATFLDAGWDFVDETDNGTEDIWWIDEGNDYPRLWWEAAGENI